MLKCSGPIQQHFLGLNFEYRGFLGDNGLKGFPAQVTNNILKKDLTSDDHDPAVAFSGSDFPSLHIYKQFLIVHHRCKILLHTPAFTPHG